MTVILEFSLPASSFGFGEPFGDDSRFEVEFDRLVPTDEGMLPYLWVLDGDLDRFEERATEASAVEELSRVERLEERGLYEASWTGTASTVVSAIGDADGTVLSARGTAERFRFRVRFPGRSRARIFQSRCADSDVAIEIEKLYGSSGTASRERYGLTEKQYSTIRLAYERGYFEEPREVTLENLGSELDISSRAVSQRLRRATARLVDRMLEDDPEPIPSDDS